MRHKILFLLMFFVSLSFTAHAVDVGDDWAFWGDSQTDDAAADSARWIVMVAPIAVSSYWNGGLSSSYLSAGILRYEGAPGVADFTWVHFQESGNQDRDGERTASDFGDTFEDAVNSIRTNSPNAVISYETAFSFGREAESYRNWDSYNVELLSRVADLAAEGVTVYVGDTDANIKALEEIVTDPDDIWCQAGTGCEYHYRSLGNLMVALTVWEAVGFNREDMVMTDPEILALDSDYVQAALDIAFAEEESPTSTISGVSGTFSTVTP